MPGDYAKIQHYWTCWWMQNYTNNCTLRFAMGKSPWISMRDVYPNSSGFGKFNHSVRQMATWKHYYIKLHWVIWTSYLLCYHEVIAERLTGTNGSQQKNKDHVQKPPANNKNTVFFFPVRQDHWYFCSSAETGDNQVPASCVFNHSAWAAPAGINLTPVHVSYPLQCTRNSCSMTLQYPWGEATCTIDVCGGE